MKQFRKQNYRWRYFYAVFFNNITSRFKVLLSWKWDIRWNIHGNNFDLLFFFFWPIKLFVKYFLRRSFVYGTDRDLISAIATKNMLIKSHWTKRTKALSIIFWPRKNHEITHFWHMNIMHTTRNKQTTRLLFETSMYKCKWIDCYSVCCGYESSHLNCKAVNTLRNTR